MIVMDHFYDHMVSGRTTTNMFFETLLGETQAPTGLWEPYMAAQGWIPHLDDVIAALDDSVSRDIRDLYTPPPPRTLSAKSIQMIRTLSPSAKNLGLTVMIVSVLEPCVVMLASTTNSTIAIPQMPAKHGSNVNTVHVCDI